MCDMMINDLKSIFYFEFLQHYTLICCDFVLDADRALELLEKYHEKLTKPQDKALRGAIERVIRIFQSRLFLALLGQFIMHNIQTGLFIIMISLSVAMLNVRIKML